jgi:ammonium transporter, Amt family
LFAADYIAHLDGTTIISGGFLSHHYIQIAYQLADSVAGFAYSFGGSCLILVALNFIPGMHLRASEEDEIMGMDDTEVGEFAVCFTSVGDSDLSDC